MFKDIFEAKDHSLTNEHHDLAIAKKHSDKKREGGPGVLCLFYTTTENVGGLHENRDRVSKASFDSTAANVVLKLSLIHI